MYLKNTSIFIGTESMLLNFSQNKWVVVTCKCVIYFSCIPVLSRLIVLVHLQFAENYLEKYLNSYFNSPISQLLIDKVVSFQFFSTKDPKEIILNLVGTHYTLNNCRSSYKAVQFSTLIINPLINYVVLLDVDVIQDNYYL